MIKRLVYLSLLLRSLSFSVLRVLSGSVLKPNIYRKSEASGGENLLAFVAGNE